MGLIVKLPFDDGDRIVEIDNQKNCTFLEPELDMEQEQMLRFMTGQKSDELRFFEDYSERGFSAIQYSHVENLRRYYHDEWINAFVDAVVEQGAGAWGEGLTNEDVAKLLYGEAFDDEDYDYIEQVMRLVERDTVIAWMVDSLRDSINSKGYPRPSADRVAAVLKPYIDPATDVNVTLEKNDEGYDEPYQHTVIGTYEMTVKGVQVAKWSKALFYEIYDEVSFYGNTDSDEVYTEGSKEIEENAISALQELGVDLPEFEDPSPPDHPEKDENGAFAVLYEYDENYGVEDRAETWVIVPYKERYQARDAIDIAESILGRFGEQEHVTLTLMRRLTEDEKMARRQIDAFEPEGEEYEDEWTPYKG